MAKGKAPAKSPASKPPAAARGKKSQAEADFAKASVIRGDAVPARKGKLPPGATFSIEGTDADGTPIIKRKRFSTR